MKITPAARRRELSHLVHLLQLGIVSGADADEAFHTLLRVLEADSLAIAQGGYRAWNVTLDVPPAWLDAHRKHEADDPSRAILAGSAPGSFYFVESDSRPEHLESALYDKFVGAGLRDAAIAKLYNPFIDDLFLAVYRSAGARPFDANDRLLLTLLYPHLAGALAARRAVDAIEAPPSESRRAALARVSAYAYVVWPGPRVAWSEGGRAYWQERLAPISPSNWRRIERAVIRAATRFSSSHVGGRSQLLVRGVRAEIACVPHAPRETQRMVVLFVDDPVGREPRVGPAAELLSERELAVARAAAAGASIREIARALAITPETARTHLKSVYARLRVSRRSELALLFPEAGGGG